MNGTSVPSDRATLAMSDASVDRITRSNAPDSRATSTVYAINGLPPRSRRFFPGSPFDPPRAVITPRTRRDTGIVFFQPRSSCSAASVNHKRSKEPDALKPGQRWNLLEIVPADQPVLRDRSPCDTPEHVAHARGRNAGAGSLRPDVLCGNWPPRRDVADRHHAVQRHVPHVLLARLNLLGCTQRLLDRADVLHEPFELLRLHGALLIGAGQQPRHRTSTEELRYIRAAHARTASDTSTCSASARTLRLPRRARVPWHRSRR